MTNPYLHNVVADMVSLFKEGLVNKNQLLQENKDALFEAFHSVPTELKASVFQSFLDNLEREGVDYDREALA